MATKTQQAAAQTPPAVGDPHAVYPTPVSYPHLTAADD